MSFDHHVLIGDGDSILFAGQREIWMDQRNRSENEKKDPESGMQREFRAPLPLRGLGNRLNYLRLNPRTKVDSPHSLSPSEPPAPADARFR